MFNSAPGELPNYLIDAVPGAREALDAWQASADSDETKATQQRVASAVKARVGKVRWAGGAEGRNRVMHPAAGVSHEEFDALNRELAEAERAQAEETRKRNRLRRTYDALVTSEALSRIGAQRISAVRAIELQAEASAAWATLFRVLPERDEAYRRAGRPGRAWSDVAGSNTFASSPMATRDAAEHFYMEAIDGFSTIELMEIAEGGVAK